MNENDDALFLTFVENKQYEQVAKILSNGRVNINMQDYNRNTALHIAAANHDVKMADLLIRQGIDTSILNAYNYSALAYALHMCGGFSNKVVDLLLKNNNVIKNQNKITFTTDIFVPIKNTYEKILPALNTAMQNKNPQQNMTNQTSPKNDNKINDVNIPVVIPKPPAGELILPQPVTPIYSSDDEVYADVQPHVNNYDDRSSDDEENLNNDMNYEDAEDKFEKNRIYKKN